MIPAPSPRTDLARLTRATTRSRIVELAPTVPCHDPLDAAVGAVDEPLMVVDRGGGMLEPLMGSPATVDPADLQRMRAYVPPCPINLLGDLAFMTAHGTRYACMAGAMANGISSVEIVEAMARAGMLGIFGAAGLPLPSVEKAIDRLQSRLDHSPGREGVHPCHDSLPYGFNLIHSPHEPDLEAAVVDLYLRRGVRLVEASAFLDLTLPFVRYRLSGIHRGDHGTVVTPNRVIAKVSRVEVASKFLAPAPDRMIRELVHRGELTEDQAEMAAQIPLADDLTAEADSGGHTDNQPAIVLLPTMIAIRDRFQAQHQYADPVRVGAAGGISTPWAAAAAFAMGASYLVTGSINQSCVESGTSPAVRKLLAQAQQADIAMAPAADMFEMGVKVQVLKRGTMFAMRAARLYEIYRTHDSLDQIKPADRASLEKTFFRTSLEEVWEQTKRFFAQRDPSQIERGETDPKHKMSLVFRWYLGQSSHWANAGEPSRLVDYQIWCGPAMAAFNDWVRGTFLESPENRDVATLALNLLHGAAVLTRTRTMTTQGVPVLAGFPQLRPLPRPEIEKRARTSYHSGSSANR